MMFGDKQTNVIQPAGLSGAQHVGLEDPHKPLAARAKKEPESVEAKHGRMKVTNENRSTFRKRSSRALLCCKSPSLRQKKKTITSYFLKSHLPFNCHCYLSLDHIAFKVCLPKEACRHSQHNLPATGLAPAGPFAAQHYAVA